MFTPTHFTEDRLSVLHGAIHDARLATLVTMGTGGIEASHVPVSLDADDGPNGTLYGHLSKANPQSDRTDPKVDALAIFAGPDAYITPSWYETKKETERVVPTWNYVAVHAYGSIEYFDDAEQLRALVTQLTEHHEGGRDDPWAVTDAPDDFIDAMLGGIIGFKLPIARIEGKWKMSQNRPPQDREGVINGLAEEGGSNEAAVARIMANDE